MTRVQTNLELPSILYPLLYFKWKCLDESKIPYFSFDTSIKTGISRALSSVGTGERNTYTLFSITGILQSTKINT
jgi:hypothetical protein